MSDKNICGAKTKSGSPCQKSPMKDSNRCHLHGGKSLRGTASPNYKHGLYSKYAAESLKKILGELEEVDTEDLVQPDYEIKLMEALITGSKALQKNTGELDELESFSKVIDRLVKAKQRYQAIMIEQERLIPLNDVRQLFSYLEELLTNRIGEDKADQILEELQSFKISNHANN